MRTVKDNLGVIVAILAVGIAWGDLRAKLEHVMAEVAVIKSRLGLADGHGYGYAGEAVCRGESEQDHDKLGAGTGGNHDSRAGIQGEVALESLAFSRQTQRGIIGLVDRQNVDLRPVVDVCGSGQNDRLQRANRVQSGEVWENARSPTAEGSKKEAVFDDPFK